MMARRQPTSYVMRGGARKLPKRPTVLDDPDPRIAPLATRRISVEAVERITKSRGADSRLSEVDHLACRWARGEGAQYDSAGRHPLETIALLHDGAVLGGGPVGVPEEIALFDECFRQADDHHRAIIRVWYGNTWPVETKAKRIGVSRATLYREWGRTLSHFHGWLIAHGLDFETLKQ